ncbi:MAG: hypothetical protein HWE25_07060 [Alphaproteobacteria bacterium]|nr:hypothetical protein [Alphaproteobacteria bacterium]
MIGKTMMAATVLGTSLLAVTAGAEEAGPADVMVFEAEKKALVGTLFDVQMSLERRSSEEAEFGLNKAAAQLEALVKEGIEDEALVETAVVKLAELKYGSALLPKVVFVPLDDTPLTVEAFQRLVDLRGIDRGDVEDAKVRYVHLVVQRNKLAFELNDAREQLAKDDLDDARGEVADAQKSMIRDFVSVADPEVKTRDHIALSKFMIRAGEYEGAREALQDAEKAMIDLQLDASIAGSRARVIEHLKKELDALSDIIHQGAPSLAENRSLRD